jgi:hypothetical protein
MQPGGPRLNVDLTPGNPGRGPFLDAADRGWMTAISDEEVANVRRILVEGSARGAPPLEFPMLMNRFDLVVAAIVTGQVLAVITEATAMVGLEGCSAPTRTQMNRSALQ